MNSPSFWRGQGGGFTYNVEPRTFHFLQPAGTSRGVYTERQSWLVHLRDTNTGIEGIGECAPLPDLSCDAKPDYERTLESLCQLLCTTGRLPEAMLRPYPSMRFGLETALQQIRRQGSTALFDTPFSRGEEGIPINGLVWMGTHEEMLSRIEVKLKQGFHCVKLKIGAIDFEDELDMVHSIRSRYGKQEVELRVDANGGFTPENALHRMERLSKYDIHSIEQPIRQHQWAQMACLCRESPLPIALDEELIGVNLKEMKEELLDTIRPAYLVLKPSLHGGMSGTEEWIALARQRGIGSWITSALESNVGLNAVAQLCAKVYGPGISFPQGLGTGQLFADNIPFPIEIRGEEIWSLPPTPSNRRGRTSISNMM